MSSLEAKAEEYYQKRPEGFGYPRDDFMAGYRQAIEDAASIQEIQIGPYTLSIFQAGGFWLCKEDGEGMQVSNIKLITLIDKFFNEEM